MSQGFKFRVQGLELTIKVSGLQVSPGVGFRV